MLQITLDRFPSFETKFITPELLVRKYLNSVFITCKYTIENNELFKTNTIDICYFRDLDKKETYNEMILNLKSKLFNENTAVSFKLHNYIDKNYLIVPQSYFLNQTYFKDNYRNGNE